MIIDDSEDKKKIKFETVAINPSIDPNGGYWLRLKLAQPLAEKTVFNEVAETLPIKITPKTIAYILDATLTTTASKVARDGIPRKLGDLLKFYPTARGKVDKPSSVFNPDTCSGVVAVCALKGLERSVDLTSVHFVNVRTGVVVTVSSIMSVGSVNDGAIRKGREIRVAGKNLQFDAALGDTVEVVYSENGEENSLVLTPRSSDELCLSFDWPEALTNVASGTVLTFVFKTRGGIAESETQENRFDVLLKDAE